MNKKRIIANLKRIAFNGPFLSPEERLALHEAIKRLQQKEKVHG